MPQWLEVDFDRERSVSRFIVITYEQSNGPGTSQVWGIRDYELQVWDEGRWRTVTVEDKGRLAKTRVHELRETVRTDRIRLVVDDVAPVDGAARMLELEAWGTGRL